MYGIVFNNQYTSSMFFYNGYNEIFQEFNTLKFAKSEVYTSLHFEKTREQDADLPTIYNTTIWSRSNGRKQYR